VGGDRNIAATNTLKKFFHARKGDRENWLRQKTYRVSDAEKTMAGRNRHENRYVIIGSVTNRRECLLCPGSLQLCGSLSDLRARIIVQAWKNMWCAGCDGYTIRHKGSAISMETEVSGTIVDGGQNVAMSRSP
jgi:hypothetical protein